MSAKFATILVVDDDERVLKAFAKGCRDGRSILTAQTSKAALELAHRMPPELLIVDLRLGTESGLDLMRALRMLIPGIAVVVISGYLSVAAAEIALKEGATSVAFKPVTLTEILQRVEGQAAVSEPSLDETPTLARAEWEHMMRVLEDCCGNKSLAARRLGIARQSLQRKLLKDPPKR